MTGELNSEEPMRLTLDLVAENKWALVKALMEIKEAINRYDVEHSDVVKGNARYSFHLVAE